MIVPSWTVQRQLKVNLDSEIFNLFLSGQKIIQRTATSFSIPLFKFITFRSLHPSFFTRFPNNLAINSQRTHLCTRGVYIFSLSFDVVLCLFFIINLKLENKNQNLSDYLMQAESLYFVIHTKNFKLIP